MTKPSIVIVTDNPKSWSIPSTNVLVEELRAFGCDARLVHTIKESPAADVAIFVSCERLVPASERARFGRALVAHASDLPRGRGWSPLTWQILEGAERVTVTLFEAVDEVDAGAIFGQHEIQLEGHELIGELRTLVDRAIHDLVFEFVHRWPDVAGRAQTGEPTFYRRRTPADSRIDLDKPLRESFNLLRVVDNDRYPAFFEHAGYVYELRITKRGPVR